MSAARILATLGRLSAGPAIIVGLAGGTLFAVYVAQLVGNDVSVGSSRGEVLLHCGLFVLLAGGSVLAPSLGTLGPRRTAATVVPGWALDIAILVIVVELATIVSFVSLGAIGGGRAISFDRHGLGLLLVPGLSVLIVAMVLWELVRCRLRRWQRRRVRLRTPIVMVSTLAAVAGSSGAYAWAAI